ncbi:DNA polymerase III subunit delta [Acidisoma cellulosilytica]|uniref:DNA-directed DNA polymerase n=1 Tax=Acidisoma cellulosilyticum TaxID=2802395 RepID=A0A963Z2T3_9PROT|nr:DNA polymerase III subunit delta [Acidisoma cellulosilyticum]MCB8880835.1 DNA polymerase III subunit delta [Acidisoma cellulosilyticum]
MKLDARDFTGLCKDAGRLRAILIYGPDAGLVRERGETLARAVAGALDDPFRFTELTKPDAGTLALEATALSFTGGRRVVRVREAGDTLTATLTATCKDAEGSLIILEAGELTPRSKLRSWAEKDARAGALACYAEEGAALKTTLRSLFESEKVAVANDALDWLVQHAGADRGMVRAEVEKLSLLVGEGGTVDLDAVQLVAGDQADLSIEDALFAATRGAVAEADRATAAALAEGASAVGLIRAAHGHMDKLARIAAARETGLSAQDAVKALRPPIFFRRERAMLDAAELWRAAAISVIQLALRDAEMQCKRTGLPAEAIAHAAVLAIARRAARLKNR